VITGAGIGLGSLLPKTYNSNAQILLGLKPKGATIDPYWANLYLKERAMTYAQMVTADDVITPVATAAALDPDVLRGRVVAAVVPETMVLNLQVTGSSPEEAVALTQALSGRFRVQVSALNVQTGGPAMLTAQLSAPQPAAAPNQLHGKTLAAVSGLVGVIVAVLLALLVAVIQRNRAVSRPQPLRPVTPGGTTPPRPPGGDDAAAPVGVPATTDTTLPISRRTVNGTRRRVRAPFQTIGSRQRRLGATSRTKGPST
jgi:capsular polysaccharide biosynthesis protein